MEVLKSPSGSLGFPRFVLVFFAAVRFFLGAIMLRIVKGSFIYSNTQDKRTKNVGFYCLKCHKQISNLERFNFPAEDYRKALWAALNFSKYFSHFVLIL